MLHCGVQIYIGQATSARVKAPCKQLTMPLLFAAALQGILQAGQAQCGKGKNISSRGAGSRGTGQARHWNRARLAQHGEAWTGRLE